MKTAFIGFLVLVSQAAQATTLFVDLRDLARFRKAAEPEAAAILTAMETTPQLFFPGTVTANPDGAGRSRDKVLTNTVFGAEFEAPTTHRPSGGMHAAVIALFHDAASGMTYRRYEVTLGGSPLAVTSVKERAEFPSSETRFSAQVSLLQRELILTDAAHGVRKVYPIAPGGFALDETRLLTPLYAHATLSRDHAIPELSDPDYYAGMPYIPVVNHAGVVQPIAFHIVQHAAEAPGGLDYNYMIRGFDSHGCIRLREKDLYELFSILASQGVPTIGVDFHMTVTDPVDHPYPLNETSYMRIQNFGTAENPEIRRDEHGLVIMERIHTAPPIEKLSKPADSLMNLIAYPDGEFQTIFVDN